MNAADFKVIVDNTIAETADLLVKKNAEYAGGEDVLANFKRNGERNGQSVLDCWMTYTNKHIDSIHTYMHRVKVRSTVMALRRFRMLFPLEDIDDKSFNDFIRFVEESLPDAIQQINAELSEPIEGRFNDIINYSILCKGILAELTIPKERHEQVS